MTTSSPSPDPAPGPADLALPITDAGLARRLGERMAEVEEALFGHAVSRAPYVTTAAQHLLSAGGKRFRPLLVLLAAEAGEHPESDDVITVRVPKVVSLDDERRSPSTPGSTVVTSTSNGA